jgi:hypothetical protein
VFTRFATCRRTDPPAPRQPGLTEALDLQVLERRQVETMKLSGGRLFVTPGMNANGGARPRCR